MIFPISKISTQTTTDVVDHHIHVSKTHDDMTNMHDSYVVHVRYASVIHTSLFLQQKNNKHQLSNCPPSRVSNGFSNLSSKRAEKMIRLVQIINTTAFAPGGSSPRVWGLFFVFKRIHLPDKVFDFYSQKTNQIDPREKTTNKGQSHKAFIYVTYIRILYIHCPMNSKTVGIHRRCTHRRWRC